jgi:hypothetical protein
MKHFQAEEWADLVRDVASAEAARAMQEHLHDGCQACQAIVDGFRAVVEVSAREANCEPPDHVVRSVKALLALARPQKRTLAALVFDSLRQPVLAGVRSAGAAARQIVFKSGDVVVDLKLDPIPGSNLVQILGQVMQKQDSCGVGCVPVALRKGAQQFAKTFANRFGEFQFEARISSDLNLVIVLPESRLVEVPLGTFEDAKAT